MLVSVYVVDTVLVTVEPMLLVYVVVDVVIVIDGTVFVVVV